MPSSTHVTMRGARPMTGWVVLALVWVAAAATVWAQLDRGWIPHDEGTLAQSAERVLGGALPHRDFDEVYSGGLSFLNAAAFGVFGIRLFSLRLPLFGLFLFWVPALYYIATRFAQPALAGLVAALGVAWSLPQYSAAMPSWYNLFLATLGTAGLLRHLETGRRRWLFVAGVAGGLSCVVKIVGLYYVAAVLLFLVFREQMLTADSPRPAARWGAYPVAVGAGLATFVAMLLRLVHTRLAVPEIVQFVLPGAALAVFVAVESARSEAPGGKRLATLLRLAAPFALGVALPVFVFVIPYLRADAIASLWNGVFVVPARRLDFAARSLPGPATLLGGVPVALLLGVLPTARIPGRRIVLAILLVTLVAFFILSRHAVWYSIRPLVPLMVLVGLWRLARQGDSISRLRRQQVLLVLAVTALASLVVFPFARPIYFFYVAPLAAIAVLAVTASGPRHPDALAGVVLGLYLLFAVVDTHPSREPMERMALERGGLVVGARDAARYDSLVQLLRAHASGGYVYAAPDCPEVSFLAGLKNPTRTFYEFLGDSTDRTELVLRALNQYAVTAVALNQLPLFSGPLPGALLDSLAARYPREVVVDRFTVRWRP